jgi:hypothetical protein
VIFLIIFVQRQPLNVFIKKEVNSMNTNDPYAKLMEHLEYPDSNRLRAILEYLMTVDQATMVAALPGTAQDVAQKTGLDAEKVQEEFFSSRGLSSHGATL